MAQPGLAVEKLILRSRNSAILGIDVYPRFWLLRLSLSKHFTRYYAT
jgi:hypothetical protein